MLRDSDISFLKEHYSFYSSLSENEKEEIKKSCVYSKYKKGHLLYSSENNCKGLIFLINGKLRAYLFSPEGKEITLFYLKENHSCILSASCLFKNITFKVSIEAKEDCEIILMPSSLVEKLSSTNLHFNKYILDLTQEKFSKAMWVMEQLVFSSFDKRLKNYLSSFNSEIILTTHEDIAKDLGTAREVVSRMLKYFHQEGFIEVSRGKIKIIDLEDD